MRLALVIASLGAGGAERVATILCNRWTAAGHSVSLITFEPKSSWDEYEIAKGIHIVRLNVARASSGLASAIRNNLFRIATLRRCLRECAPDVTISFLTDTNVLTLLASIGASWPVVISERIHAPSHPVNTMWSAMRRRTYPRADAIVVQTNAMADWAKGHFGIDADVIPNPTDFKTFGSRPDVIDRAPLQ
jgi:UDP-N-acetylglucosamine:LPS N-acetylglucosamine transferase